MKGKEKINEIDVGKKINSALRPFFVVVVVFCFFLLFDTRSNKSIDCKCRKGKQTANGKAVEV